VRIDKFLKTSRLIKRRTLAHEACKRDRVKINGKAAKPGSTVKVGDIIKIQFGSSTTQIKVVSVAEHVSKKESAEMYVILENRAQKTENEEY
jgi:ribosomal 50S subunit-recycling heat shock protein